MELRTRDDITLSRALGYAHAHDRLTAMVLLRLIGQGRLSECLKASKDTLAIDIFMKRHGFQRQAALEIHKLSEEARKTLEAYCAGVNEYIQAFRRPTSLLVVGHRPEPWTIADCLLIVKIMGYVGLAQSQGDAEAFIAQCIASGVISPSSQGAFLPPP